MDYFSSPRLKSSMLTNANCSFLKSTHCSLCLPSPGQAAGQTGRTCPVLQADDMALQQGQSDENWWLRAMISSDVFFRPCQSCNQLKGRDCLVNFFDLETGTSACVACLPEHRGNRLLQVSRDRIVVLSGPTRPPHASSNIVQA